MIEKFMPDQIDKKIVSWNIISGSVIGSSHARVGLKNQDAENHWVTECAAGHTIPLVLAISDGHGSVKSFRSHTGSEYAVKVAVRAVRDFFDECSKNNIDNLSLIKDELENRLPRKIVQAWREEVETDVSRNPFTEEELKELEKKSDARSVEAVLKDNKIVYGSTLLMAGIHNAFMFYMQLGDGDILSVYEDGTTVRAVARDEKLIANETTSFCSKDPWNEFRIKFYPVNADFKFPELILISTDGYSNSFRDDDNFFKVGKDILDILRSEGAVSTECSIREWLEASAKMSGDDVTLGMIIKDYKKYI
ncbi:MAG: hypothetical protein BWY32_03091 [bacterium ADurb.Bin243]|nr:MAG: hypothetical protein BWY32_03091 [bacterium ADurb.Bin243]